MATNKFQQKYRIPSARANWHDYNAGMYFITVCTAGMKHYFGKIEDGAMQLNVLGEYLNTIIVNTQTHNRYAEIPLFVIMPNHLHLIVCIDNNNVPVRDAACHVSTGNRDKNEKMQEIAEKCGLLSTTIGGIKSALTKYARANGIEFGWQTRFHDRIIRDQDECNRIALYIENNPATWLDDKYQTVG